MGLQFIDIKDSKIKFVNKEDNPEVKIDALQNENALLWFENMELDAKVDEESSALWFVIMTEGGI